MKILEQFENTVRDRNLIVNQHYYKRLIKLLEYLIDNYEQFTKTLKTTIVDYQFHHIIPRSWNGSDDINNLVRIPTRTHFIVHKLMYKSFPEDVSMITAFMLMCNCSVRKINSRTYARLRKKFIDLVKLEFKEGKRVSNRKGMVMAKYIPTGETLLIPRDIYYSDDEYIGISTGAIRSDEHKKRISECMKIWKKTDKQKESARGLQLKLTSKKIICTCCNKSFDIGNYTKHIKNITTKGRRHSDETKMKIKKAITDSRKLNGTTKRIYSFSIENTHFITYDLTCVCNYFKISRPTCRLRYDPKQIGSHRNHNNIKIIDNFDIINTKVFEDIYN